MEMLSLKALLMASSLVCGSDVSQCETAIAPVKQPKAAPALPKTAPKDAPNGKKLPYKKRTAEQNLNNFKSSESNIGKINACPRCRRAKPPGTLKKPAPIPQKTPVKSVVPVIG